MLDSHKFLVPYFVLKAGIFFQQCHINDSHFNNRKKFFVVLRVFSGFIFPLISQVNQTCLPVFLSLHVYFHLILILLWYSLDSFCELIISVSVQLFVLFFCLRKVIPACCIFFHSNAWDVETIMALWWQWLVKNNVAHRIGNRLILVGEHTKTPKDGRKMPVLTTLHQDSDNHLPGKNTKEADQEYTVKN